MQLDSVERGGGNLHENHFLEDELKKHFGFDSFRKGQKEVVARILNGESAVAIFPTGSGKSICYQLPAILMPGLTLLVSPLISLMKDQTDFLKSRGIEAERLDFSLDDATYSSIIEKARSGKLKILMISVERFRNERFRNNLQKMNISLLVVDEAHCISEWGHNFRPDYIKLPNFRDEFSIPQVLLLTATATSKVSEDMCLKFGIPEKNVTCTGFYRKNLFLQVTPVKEQAKQEYLLERLMRNKEAPTVIYVTLQKTAEKIAEYLTSFGFPALHYHAGMKGEERESVQNRFMNGEAGCIVATIAFGMGIDKKDIRRVIHFDMPKSLEGYCQEIGRAGRDGELAFCEVMANLDSLNILENFIYGDTPSKNSIVALLEIIKRHPDQLFEVKLISLSSLLDMRQLPFRTLMVYLEMEGIIKPLYTRYDEYVFKYITPRGEIESFFRDERRAFVKTLLDNCFEKKVWVHVDMQAVLSAYAGADRKRIVAALDYFAEKGWIELKASRSIDVYEILESDFDIEGMASRLHSMFASKEGLEIERIHEMLELFQKDFCLSAGLALFFGENPDFEKCGHCFHCRSGKITLARTEKLPDLVSMSRDELYGEFRQKAELDFNAVNTTKFLCGITAPHQKKMGARNFQGFGALEKYPYSDVLEWVEAGFLSDHS